MKDIVNLDKKAWIEKIGQRHAIYFQSPEPKQKPDKPTTCSAESMLTP